MAHFKVLYVEEHLNQVINLDFKDTGLADKSLPYNGCVPRALRGLGRDLGLRVTQCSWPWGAYNLRHIERVT